jgi:hypothetical protein
MILNPQTGDAKVSSDDVLNRMFPGGGALSADAIHSAMATFPAMQRTIQEKLEAEDQVTPKQVGQVATQPTRAALASEAALPFEERADIEARVARGEGKTADFTILDAQNRLEVLTAFREQAPPELQAKAESLGLMNTIVANELQAEGVAAIVERLETASPFEKEVITASLAGPQGQGWLNYLQGERQFDQNWDLTTYQSNLALARDKASTDYTASVRAAGDATEAAAAQTKLLWEARDRSRATVDRLLEVTGDSARRGEIPALMEDLRYDAQTIFMIDPASAATIGNEVRGILRRNQIKGVEFDVQSLWDQAGPAAQLIGAAETFATLIGRPSVGQAGDPTGRGEVEGRAQAQLIEAFTDATTGRFDSRGYDITQNYILKLREDPDYFNKIRAQASATVALEAQSGADAPTLNQMRATRQAEIEKIKTEMRTGGLNVSAEKSTRLYYLMLTDLLSGYGTRTPSPRTLK